jgi:putative peptidoglycan lipid II flippase
MFQRVRNRRTLVNASIVLSVALLVGRVSGLLRDLVLSYRLGLSASADLAIVLLTIPDLLVNVLLSGGISAALVPAFRKIDDVQSKALFHQLITYVTIVFSAMALLIVIVPQAIFAIIAPGVVRNISMMPATALLLMAVTLPLTALSGITTAFLNAKSRFLIPGLGTAVFNASIIAVLLVGLNRVSILELLAIGMVLGALARLLTQSALIPWAPYQIGRAEGPADAILAKAFVAGVLAAAAALAVPIIVRAAASLMEPGTIASFNYAQKLIELPVGVLITTIGTIALTKLSGHYASNDPAAAAPAALSSLNQALSLALAVTLFGAVFMDAVVQLVYQRGAMDAAATERVVALARIAILGVPFVAISSVATADLNAQSRTATVLKITLASALVVPMVAGPALLVGSEIGLMASVVAFQIVLAAGLAKAAGTYYWSRQGIGSASIVKAALVSGLSCALVYGFLKAMSPVSVLTELLCVGVGFFAAVGIARRF